MTESETRVLARTAAVLLVASMARFGWEARRGGPPAPSGAGDDGPALLAESRRLAGENAARSRPLGADERLDPNRASAVDLDRLPGLGPAAARAIVAARARDGAFTSVDDLLDVPGIGAGTLARIRSHLELGPAPAGLPRRARGLGAVGGRTDRTATTGAAGKAGLPRARAGALARGTRRSPPDPQPVDLNRATAAELERLPGVGPALAGRIIEERAQKGPFGSPDDLLRVRGIGPAILERLRPLVRVGGG